MNNRKVLTALSGGVDSSCAVLLLQQQGYEVAGVVMMMSEHHRGAVEAAEAAAEALHIELYVLDLRNLFQQKVVDPFIQEYKRGRTPNPCVICNPNVKFAALLETANQLGYDYIATGHYARVEQQGQHYVLKKAISKARDQSYMLYQLNQDVLSKLLLPLGEMEKDEVRNIAKAADLPSHSSPDSQEICFIPDNDYAGFIEQFGGCKPGELIGPDQKVCGTHKGIHRYTIGQRKGLGITFGQPVFVSKIDAELNRVYLCYSGGEFINSVELADCVYNTDKNEPLECHVKIRSAAKPSEATIYPSGDTAKVVFSKPERAAAPGQAAVFYHDDILLGGGIIQ